MYIHMRTGDSEKKKTKYYLYKQKLSKTQHVSYKTYVKVLPVNSYFTAAFSVS